MAKTGQPLILDEMKRREVCALIAAGCGMETAAYYVGCSTRTIRREAQRNDGFREALRRAELSTEITSLRALRDASGKHWRAAAWLLERTQPDRYGKKNPAAITPESAMFVLDNVANVIAEELEDDEEHRLRILNRLEKILRDAHREFVCHSNTRRDVRQELAEHKV